MDVIKSSRFWLALVVILGAIVLAVLKLITGGEAVATALGVLGGFGVAKAGGSPSDVIRALLPLVIVGALLSGCKSTVGAHLERAHIAVKATDSVALAAFSSKCRAAADACGPVGADLCPAWKECDAKRTKYTAAMNAIDESLAVVNRLLSDLGVE